MTVGQVRQVLEELAAEAPDVRVPSQLYRTARRRHRQRARRSAAAIAVALLTVVTTAAVAAEPREQFGDGGSASLPARVKTPPWWTATVKDSPPGPAAVAFTAGKDTVQADYDDFQLQWWREGHTVYPAVIVGLQHDTYRIARGSFSVGVELSPDGRYLLVREGIADLATGRVEPYPGFGSLDALNEWSADGHHFLHIDNATTTVVAWPSKRIEWQVRPQRPTGDAQYMQAQHQALAPDGAKLAVQAGGQLTVYTSGGTRLWSVHVGENEMSGPAAWRADGRVALMVRGVAVCPACPGTMLPYPSTWRLTFLDGSTGASIAGASYPPIRSALAVRVVAWRGDVAYAVVVYSNGRTDIQSGPGWAELVRLRPGAHEPETVVQAPTGTANMNVAADYVDAVRQPGRVDSGLNLREVGGWAATVAPCVAPFVAAFIVLLVRIARRRRQPPYRAW